MRYVLIVLLLQGLAGLSTIKAQQEMEGNLDRPRAYVLAKVNKLRTEGCKCGRKRMKPTHPLTWNETLTLSAERHASDMDRYNYFGHRSRSGADIGDRLDAIGYKWQYVGENLAEGQDSFEEALTDWLESDSHCRMLMNPDMKEMGMAKIGKYWVHHFGTQMPPKYKRVKKYYREGE